MLKFILDIDMVASTTTLQGNFVDQLGQRTARSTPKLKANINLLAMAKKKNVKVVNRSAVNGKFVTKKFVKDNPRTTERETRPKRK